MRVFLSLLLLAIALPSGAFSAAPSPAVSQPTPAIVDEFHKMMTALEKRDYDAFVADGSPEVKAGLTQQMFEGVADLIGLRLKRGYDAAYLTQLKQQGCEVYVWKVVVGDGGDDFLAKLAMQAGKVAGFRIQ